MLILYYATFDEFLILSFEDYDFHRTTCCLQQKQFNSVFLISMFLFFFCRTHWLEPSRAMLRRVQVDLPSSS